MNPVLPQRYMIICLKKRAREGKECEETNHFLKAYNEPDWTSRIDQLFYYQIFQSKFTRQDLSKQKLFESSIIFISLTFKQAEPS